MVSLGYFSHCFLLHCITSLSPQPLPHCLHSLTRSASPSPSSHSTTDVEALVNDASVLSESVKADMLCDYNTSQYVHVEDQKNNVTFLLTPYNKVSTTSFLEPNSGVVYNIDHLNKSVTGVAEGVTAEPSAHDSVRNAVSSALSTYAGEAYKKGKCVTGAYIQGNNLVIVISAINTNLGAFWTGNWKATYTIDLSSGSGVTPVTANLEIHVHYFEAGNLQLKATYQPSNVTADISSAEDIVKTIAKVEGDWQANIERMYVDMHHQTFRAMRRILPISKTTMNWAMSAHSLNEELSK